MKRAARLRKRDILVPLAYALVGTLWIAGSDFVLAQWWIDDAATLAWAGTLKGLGFILFTSIALFAALRSKGASDLAAPGSASGRNQIALLIAGSTLLLLATAGLLGIVHIRNLTDQLRPFLQADAQRAAGAIAVAIETRRRHARSMARSPVTVTTIARWLDARHIDDEELLRRHFAEVATERSAMRIALLTVDGDTLLEHGQPYTFASPSASALHDVLETGQPAIDVGKSKAGVLLHTIVPVVALSGETIGILVVTDGMLDFGNILNRYATADVGPVSLLLVDDQRGSLVLAASDPLQEAVGDRLPKSIADSLNSKRTTFLSTEPLAAAAPVPSSSWRIVALRPLNAIVAPRVHAFLAAVAVMVAVAIGSGAVLLMWWNRQISLLETRAIDAEQRAEAMLRHFSMANRHANDIVLLIDENRRIIDANPVAVECYGYTRDELRTLTVDDLRPASATERECVVRQFAAAMAGSTRFETVHRRKDGTTFPVEVSSRRFDVENRAYVQSIVRDITERKRTERILAESEERFRATFEQAAVGIAHVAPDGRWLRVNKKLCQILGYKREELLATTFQHVTHPDSVLQDHGNIQAALVGVLERPYVDMLFHRKDGNSVCARLSVSLTRREDGAPDYFICVFEDITAERQQQAALEQLSRERAEVAERLQRQFSGMPFGCVVMDANLRVIDVNPAFERIFGWSREQFLMQAGALTLLLPEEGRDELLPALAAAGASGMTLQRTETNITRDGRRIICRWTNVPLPGSGRAFGGMLSMCEDITDSVRADAELRDREARFRALAERAPVGVFRISRDGRALYVNPALEKIAGRSAGDVAGFGWVAAVHPHDRNATTVAFQRTGLEHQSAPAEVRCLRPDGTVVWTQIQIAPVQSQSEEVREYVGTVIDITPFKELERTLSTRIEERTTE